MHNVYQVKKDLRVEMSGKLFRRHKNEDKNFINRIIANETRILSFRLEFNNQSSEWHTSDSPKPVKSEDRA